MGATKAYEFGTKENRLAKYGKALAHPARVAILKFLANKAACRRYSRCDNQQLCAEPCPQQRWSDKGNVPGAEAGWALFYIRHCFGGETTK